MVAERRVRGLLCVMSASIPAHAEQLSSLIIVTRTSVGSMSIVLFVATRATHPLADRIASKLSNKERVQPKDQQVTCRCVPEHVQGSTSFATTHS